MLLRGAVVRVLYHVHGACSSCISQYGVMGTGSLGARRDYADPCYTIPVHVPVVNHPP